MRCAGWRRATDRQTGRQRERLHFQTKRLLHVPDTSSAHLSTAHLELSDIYPPTVPVCVSGEGPRMKEDEDEDEDALRLRKQLLTSIEAEGRRHWAGRLRRGYWAR